MRQGRVSYALIQIGVHKCVCPRVLRKWLTEGAPRYISRRKVGEAAMFNKILVPIDFSEYTDEILEYAAEIAKKFGSSLHLIHVIPTMDYFTPYESFIAVENVEAAQKTIEAEVKKQLKETAGRITGIDVTGAVRTGAAFIEITEYAESEGIDLIVMGTHGRGGIEHLLLGSVAGRVIRRAPCPVLTIRPTKKRAETP
jgi:nucleotide-binding universal stress UspA family protein